MSCSEAAPTIARRLPGVLVAATIACARKLSSSGLQLGQQAGTGLGIRVPERIE
jgi:hypothetical protein